MFLTPLLLVFHRFKFHGNLMNRIDIRHAVVSVLAHRISLKPSSKYLISAQEFIKQEFKKFSEDNPVKEKGGCR